MSSQLTQTLILLAVCIVIVVILCKILKSILGKVIVVVVAVLVLLGGAKIIDLNTLPAKVEKKIEQVVEMLPESETYIRTEGNDVFIKVEDQWLNLSEVSIVGDFTKDMHLQYDGNDIYIGHSGVYNTIKALESVGLLGGEK